MKRGDAYLSAGLTRSKYLLASLFVTEPKVD